MKFSEYMAKILSVSSKLKKKLIYLYDKRDEISKSVVLYFADHKEPLLKLSIPVFIIFLGFYACHSSQSDIRHNIADLFVIVDEIRSSYADKPDYWGLSTEKVVKGDIIPKHFIKNNRVVLSGGLRILIGNGIRAETIMPRTLTFDIIAPDLTKAQCISYVETALTKEQLVALEQIAINNDAGSYVFSWGGENPLPVQKYASKDLCSDGKNTIIWTLK